MAKKQYGTTPWGEWFLQMLASYDESGRLSRGKTYANTGKVNALIIKDNSVGAKVKGSYAPWYHVYFKFPKLNQKTQKTIKTVLEKNPIELTALKSGIMNPTLIQILKDKKISLIPKRWNLIERDCSCPDYGDPCKHMAAVLFILAKEIDHDPRLLFNLVGIDINSINIANSDNEAEKMEALPDILLSEKEPPIPMSLRKKANRQAENLELVEPVKFEIQESYISLITSLLPKEPRFSSPSFLIKLTEFYHKAVFNYGINFYEQERINKNQKNIISSKKNISSNSISQEIPINPLWFATIKINIDNIRIDKKNFPLRPKKYITINIKIPEQDAINLTLLQAFNLFNHRQFHHEMTKSYKVIFSLYMLAGKIIQSSAFIPAIFTEEKKLYMFWKALSVSTEIKEDIKNFSQYIDEDFFVPCKKWNKEYCTEIILTSFLTEFVDALKFLPSKTYSNEKEIDDLFFSLKPINIKTPGKRNLDTVIYSWLSVLNYDNSNFEYRLELKTKRNDEMFLLSALVRKATKKTPKTKEDLKDEIENFKLEAETIQRPFVKLCTAAKKSKTPEEILKFPATLSAYLPVLSELATKTQVELSLEETSIFLQTASKLLQRFGIEIVLPKQLKTVLKPKPVVKLQAVKGAGNVISFLNMGDILSYDRGIMLGDTTISFDEFKKLFVNKSGLVKFNDQFLLLDSGTVAKMLEQYNRPVSTQEAMQAVLAEEAVCSGEAKTFIDKIFTQTEIPIPSSLNAKLRPYQQKGLNWLYANIKSGFGCLLADDMGLGKTIQIISLLLAFKTYDNLESPTLIIAPASLISNWEHEIKKFAPELRTHIYHSKGRKFLQTADVIITTYQTIQKDITKIKDKKLSFVILDEAQAIKNAGTKKSIAVKSIKAQAKIAMTGTPVENNLEDMRSIFDFFMPNYLGSAEEFKIKWRIPIELHNEAETAKKLRQITSPFLLRRLKTDPKVISDLPKKIITNQYCNLTPEQLALYENLVDTELKKIEKTEKKFERNAQILKLLTSLKQVCNHPRSYDKQSPADMLRSGKTTALIELLKEILSAGEKTLIFSQYVDSLKILQDIIKKELGLNSLMLYGQMSRAKREKNIACFQNDPAYRIFLISLKAGGTGLNLTAANRVIHFDLWYNPAVEDQATDRAFRIGQTKNVFVHRFICSGTFEEKIDSMIQKKREISDMSISSGETWMSKLSNQELKALFT